MKGAKTQIENIAIPLIAKKRSWLFKDEGRQPRQCHCYTTWQ